MVVIEIVCDQTVNGPVCLFHFRTLQQSVKTDLMEQLVKTLNIMTSLHAVEIVQHQAQLVVAVFCQRLAALAGGSVIVKIQAGSDIFRYDDALSVKVQAAHLSRSCNEVGDRLQWDQVQSVLLNQFNVIICQGDLQLIAEAGIGAVIDLLQKGGLSRVVETGQIGKVQYGRGSGLHAEQVIIHEIDGVVVKIEGQGNILLIEIVGSVNGYNGSLRRDRKLDTVIHFRDQHQKIVGLDIRQVSHAVQEVERQIHTCFCALIIDREYGAGDLVLHAGI